VDSQKRRKGGLSEGGGVCLGKAWRRGKNHWGKELSRSGSRESIERISSESNTRQDRSSYPLGGKGRELGGVGKDILEEVTRDRTFAHLTRGGF